MTALSRSDLLRGDFTSGAGTMAPPWAARRDAFVARCDRCARCIEACPQGIVVSGRGGYPGIDFSGGLCTFCGKCAESCPTGALSPAAYAAGVRPWAVSAQIDDSCLTLTGIDCRMCEDPCEERAIRFKPVVGGPPRPAVRADDCTGCGGCVRACPAGAIEVRDGQ